MEYSVINDHGLFMTGKDFARSYEHGYYSTVRFLRSMGVPADAIEEAAQAGWARAWERREQLNEPGKIVSWVNRISLNLFRKSLRGQPPTLELPEIASPERIDPTILDVRRGLGRCNAAERALLESYYVEGYTSRELGKRHRCSAGAIRVRVLRAKRRLAESMSSQGTLYTRRAPRPKNQQSRTERARYEGRRLNAG